MVRVRFRVRVRVGIGVSLGFRAQGLVLKVWSAEFRASGLELRP